MEDAHIAEPKLTENVAVFGVFDGHGGTFIFKFLFQKSTLY